MSKIAGARVGLNMEAIPEVWPVGTEVKFGAHTGTVLSYRVYQGPTVAYEIGFWTKDGEWREVWAHSFTVSATHPKQKIGYLQPSSL